MYPHVSRTILIIQADYSISVILGVSTFPYISRAIRIILSVIWGLSIFPHISTIIRNIKADYSNSVIWGVSRFFLISMTIWIILTDYIYSVIWDFRYFLISPGIFELTKLIIVIL